MLKIRVLGRGMIPRGLGLAPRKNPFPADPTLITTIMNTPGLKIEYLNPMDGKFKPITRKNLKAIYEMYGTDKSTTSTTMVTPDTGNNPSTNPELREHVDETSTNYSFIAGGVNLSPEAVQNYIPMDKNVDNDTDVRPDKDDDGICPVTAPEKATDSIAPGTSFTPVINPDDKDSDKNNGTTEISPITSDDTTEKPSEINKAEVSFTPIVNPGQNNNKHNKKNRH